MKKVNAALAVFFMYFLHRFYWKQWKNVTAVNAADFGKNYYSIKANATPTGKSINSGMEEIKVIYP